MSNRKLVFVVKSNDDIGPCSSGSRDGVSPPINQECMHDNRDNTNNFAKGDTSLDGALH